MNSETYLRLLTFCGLAIGLMGGLISQLTKTSEEVNGRIRKRLTSAGKWAFVISLLGFCGSFCSEILKSSIEGQKRVRAEIEEGLRKNQEKEEADWRKRSSELGDQILVKTIASLTKSEKNLTETIEGFQREQEDNIKTRLDIAESRQRLLNDNLMREANLYRRLTAAATALSSLTVKLTVDNVPKEILNKVREGKKAAEHSTNTDEDLQDLLEHHNADDDDVKSFMQAELDKRVIQPFISFVAHDRFAQEHGIIVLGLDKNFSALLPIGWVDKPDLIEPRDEKSVLPSGIIIDNEINFHLSYEEPPFKREKRIRPTVRLEVAGNSLTLSIDLDVTSLDDSLFRYAQSSTRSAALPEEIEFFTWSPSSEAELSSDVEGALKLPFDSVRVRESVLSLYQGRNSPNQPPDWLDTDDAWMNRNSAWLKSSADWVTQAPSWMQRMQLRIIPNGIEQISKTYVLSLFSAGYPIEGSREDEPRGYVRIWRGHARSTD
jgi:hypothetical protein